MGMKEITLPTKVLNLPQPWGETDFMHRRKQLKTLSYEPHEIKRALDVLERCLHTLWLLPPWLESGDLIPDELMEYWDFTAQSLAEEMPTLDELRLYKIEGKLKEYGIDSPSPQLIREVADYWLGSVTWNIFRAALSWVEDALITTREPILISRYLNIAKRYWQKVEPDLAQSLLSSSAIIGWQKALPLFDRVEQSLAASQEVKETARDYRKFVLLYPHRWLPEPEPEELPAKESQRLAQSMSRRMQPALGSLAYVSQ